MQKKLRCSTIFCNFVFMNQKQISKIREFNRYYTEYIGLLDKFVLGSDYTLSEARVMFEIYRHGSITAKQITKLLGIDKGYLSHMLREFEKKGLVKKMVDKADGRKQILSFTEKGENEYMALNQASDYQISELLAYYDGTEIDTLIEHMNKIQNILSKNICMKRNNTITFRSEMRPGDLGYIMYRQSKLYSEEYGYGVSFDTYVGASIGEFCNQYDPNRDRLWVCESENKIVGCVLLMHRFNNEAQLRYFFIESEYRGLGLGNKLLQMAIDFAKTCNYTQIYLWTENELNVALHLYGKFGFQLTEKKESSHFGKSVLELKFDLILNPNEIQ